MNWPRVRKNGKWFRAIPGARPGPSQILHTLRDLIYFQGNRTGSWFVSVFNKFPSGSPTLRCQRCSDPPSWIIVPVTFRYIISVWAGSVLQIWAGYLWIHTLLTRTGLQKCPNNLSTLCLFAKKIALGKKKSISSLVLYNHTATLQCTPPWSIIVILCPNYRKHTPQWLKHAERAHKMLPPWSHKHIKVWSLRVPAEQREWQCLSQPQGDFISHIFLLRSHVTPQPFLRQMLSPQNTGDRGDIVNEQQFFAPAWRKSSCCQWPEDELSFVPFCSMLAVLILPRARHVIWAKWIT